MLVRREGRELVTPMWKYVWSKRSDRMREKRDTHMKIIIIFSFKTINHSPLPSCVVLHNVCEASSSSSLNWRFSLENSLSVRQGEKVCTAKMWLSSAFGTLFLFLYILQPINVYEFVSRVTKKKCVAAAAASGVGSMQHACTILLDFTHDIFSAARHYPDIVCREEIESSSSTVIT